MTTSSDTPSTRFVSAGPVYFPNLNGVRFIACSLVLIHHIEQVKNSFHLPSVYDFYLIRNMGKLGVCLFFVLSGFLITYLLLNEKRRYHTINIRSFYMRRVLRIWPIYYLIVGLSLFVFPNLSLFQEPARNFHFFDADFYSRLGLFSIVLPNIAMIVYESPYLCAQTWSIGVEEQFYLLWPWVIKKSGTVKGVLCTLAIFSTVLIVVLYVMMVLKGQHLWPSATVVKYVLVFFFGQFRILAMVTGGLGAYLVYYRKDTILRVMFRSDVQYAVYGVLLGLIAGNVTIPGLNIEFYGLFFCFFIVNLASNPRSVVRLEQPVVNYLGKISYGVYIYHSAMIVLFVHLIRTYANPGLSALTTNVLLYSGSVLGTILVASLSFEYIEKPFLQLKKRFEPDKRAADEFVPIPSVATLNQF